MSTSVPPGWPHVVPPAGTPGWQRRAVGWLLDLCPSDYRAHAVLARQPLVLVYLAGQHVRAQLDGLARAAATLRAELSGQVPAPVVDEALLVLDVERARLLSAVRAADLIGAALRGSTYVPRL